MSHLPQDLKYAIRSLARQPGFTVVAVLTLALGIGANTAIFSIVNGVLLRPLAYPQPQQLYVVREIVPQWKQFASLQANLPDFQIWQKQVHSFEGVAIAEEISADLTGVGEPEQIEGMRVSASLFDVLGVPPALGSGFVRQEDDAGQGHVVVLTDQFWRSRFRADRSILGKTITLDGFPHTVAAEWRIERVCVCCRLLRAAERTEGLRDRFDRRIRLSWYRASETQCRPAPGSRGTEPRPGPDRQAG
jgi:hypothetical protein